MKTIPSYLTKYFIVTGLVVNLILFLSVGVLAYQVHSLGLSLPLFSEKVSDNLRVKQPSLYQVLAPLLDVMKIFQIQQHYFRQIDLSSWSGHGANGENFYKSNITDLYVSNAAELIKALKVVSAGETVVLLPGSYYIKSSSISLGNSGSKIRPIKVMATGLGEVRIYLRGEGFVVNKPYWQFSNLHIIGNCKQHAKCEHAFHVVGKGQHTVIKNNIMQDFNAMIKVNGIGKHYPDYGKVTENTFFNTTARKTINPVTPFDLMHANYWQVSNNFFFDIQKSAGNKVSYAAFFKGGSEHGVFERNLVMCAANLPGTHTAIGLSLGGGGSSQGDRRNKSSVEHEKGIIRNNIIMHCANDVGIYLNRASQSKIHHNILYNTLGIDVRFKESSAVIADNIISGRIKKRDGGWFIDEHNLVVPRDFFTGSDNLDGYFVAPDIGDFSWRDASRVKEHKYIIATLVKDFCGNKGFYSYLGAYAGLDFCLDKLNLPTKDRGNVR
ncbi:hypothetical protein [Colwellia piezophila]|uniref:hypothetical protein n=1 Tax=Colwellia piezophila TaxID=211668 RepID=UPI00036BFDA2|nr:hypothetical protein [Colwellia piezophila]